jgi:threonine dehydrogenase-like Zn-dependent dehydrogenase
MRRGGLAEGQRVLVLGAGTIGLLAVVAARALGAGEVWLCARHPHQAALGERLGAGRVLREAQADAFALDALGRESPIDLVVETVGGDANTLEAAGAAVRPGGAVAVLGVFMRALRLSPLPYFLKEVTLAWSNCYSHPSERPDFETAVQIVSGKRRALAGITTHAFPLAEIERAFAQAADKKTGAVKVTVIP